jgi:hypothetical protein
VEDVVAQVDAIGADRTVETHDELLYLLLGFAA